MIYIIVAWLPSSFINQMSVDQMSVDQMSVDQMSVSQKVFDQYDREPMYPHIWFMFHAPFEKCNGL